MKTTGMYNGKREPGTLVEFHPTNEPWAEYACVDGSLVRMRSTLVRLVRLDRKDDKGHPIYVYDVSQNVLVTNPI